MRSQFRALLALTVVSAALTACSDQPTSAPVAPRVVGFNADINLPACDFNALRDAVRAYADVGGNDVIFGYIRDMSTDPYGQGMNGLARIADIRANGPKKAGAGAAQGAAAVTAFLACMPVGALPDGFANIEAAMGAGGMFEVPTAGSKDSVIARGELIDTPFWTAKPGGAATWGSLTGQRVMVFGYKLSPTGDPVEGFDFNIVPKLATSTQFANNNKLVVGLCGYAQPTVRLKHIITTTNVEILFDEQISCLNDSPPIATLSTRQGFDLASLARRSLSLFAPQPLYAAAAVFGGGVGGAVSELSPTIPLSVTPTITYTPPPANNKAVGDALGIKVTVKSGTDPLKNATVTLTVTGNSGLSAVFLDPTANKICFQVTRTTDAFGVANFANVSVIKAGGYTLTANANFDGLVANGVVSNLFNVKNKKLTNLPPAC